MTQRELADRAGVSVDVISKLEQGSKQKALLVTLHRIAQALDVSILALLVEPNRVDTDSPAGAGGVVAIRSALLKRSIGDQSPPPPQADLEKSASFAWGAYWNGRYDTLGAVLPKLVSTARAAHHATSSAHSADRLADAYAVTASTLVHLGELDLAYLAMDRALSTAEQGDDPLYRAALTRWMWWLLLHQTGTLDQAQHLAADEATNLRQSMNYDDAKAVSMWGSLLISAGVAAARNEDIGSADALLDEAREAARRMLELGYAVRRDYESTFGLPQVIMQTVDAAIVTDRPGRALDLARELLPTPTYRWRHGLDTSPTARTPSPRWTKTRTPSTSC
jgi:transcriptional regulator with XRE-family HTH domain